MRARFLALSRADKSRLYEALRNHSVGFCSHTHTGHMTLQIVLFECLGGILIRRNRICPSVRAVKWSHMASTHQPSVYGAGSTYFHAPITNFLRERLSS